MSHIECYSNIRINTSGDLICESDIFLTPKMIIKLPFMRVII